MKTIYASEYTNVTIMHASARTLLSSYTLYSSRRIIWESQRPMSVVPTFIKGKNNPTCSCVTSQVTVCLVFKPLG